MKDQSFIYAHLKPKKVFRNTTEQSTGQGDLQTENVSLSFDTQKKIFTKSKVANYAESPKELIDSFKSLDVAQGSTKKALFLDMETVGEVGESFFSPTEIAMQTYNVAPGFKFTESQARGGVDSLISFAVAPDKKTSQSLHTLIQGLKDSSMPGKVKIGGTERSLTDMEYRALHQLIKYSDESVFTDVNIGGSTYKIINKHSDAVKSPKVPIYGTSLHNYVGQIQKGLQNIENLGEEASFENTVKGMNAYINAFLNNKAENVTMVTVNGKAYDIPRIDYLINQLNPEVRQQFLEGGWENLKGQHLDIYKTLHTFVRDPFTQLPGLSSADMYKLSQVWRGSLAEGGILREENLAPILTGSYDAFHFGHVDVPYSKDILEKTAPTIQRILSNPEQYGVKLDFNPLQYGDLRDPSKGSLFISTKGIASHSNRFVGGTFSLEDGRLVPAKRFSGSRTAPLYKDTYYKILGFQEVQLDGGPAQALAFHNLDENLIHFVASQEYLDDPDRIEKQQHSLMEMVYRNLEHADDDLDEVPFSWGGSEKEYQKLVNLREKMNKGQIDPDKNLVRKKDLAMRRYRSFFSMESGGKHDLWEQSMRALDVLDEYRENTSQLDLVDTALYEAIMNDTSEAGQRARNRLVGIFSSEFKGGYRSRYTDAKVRDLIYMEEALREDYDVYEPFRNAISKAQALNSRQRSIALIQYNEQILRKVSSGQILREAIPYEVKHKLQIPVFDPSGHKLKYAVEGGVPFAGVGSLKPEETPFTYVNVSDVSSAQQSVRRILRKSLPGEHINNPARAQKTAVQMIENLRDRGVISTNEADELLSIATGYGDNKTLINQIADSIGYSLYQAGERAVQSDFTVGPRESKFWKMVPTGRQKYPDAQQLDKKFLSQIAQQAVENATVLDGLHYTEEALNIFKAHNQSMFERYQTLDYALRTADHTDYIKRYSIRGMRSAEKAVKQIQDSFGYVDLETLLLSGGTEENPLLKFAIYDPKYRESILKMTPEEILESDFVIAMDMPFLTEKGIKVGTQEKLNQFIMDYDSKTGEIVMKTGYDALIDEISQSARYIRRVYDEYEDYGGKAAQQNLSGVIQGALDNLSGAGEKYVPSDFAQSFDVEFSPVAAKQKSDMVIYRTHGMIERFLAMREKELHDKPYKTEQDISELNHIKALKGRRNLTLGDLSYSQRNIFDRYMMDVPMLESPSGEVVTVGSMIKYGSSKESESLMGMGSMVDVRDYLPFGRYTSSTTQRARQAFQVYDLDTPVDPKDRELFDAIRKRGGIKTRAFDRTYRDRQIGLRLVTAYATDDAIQARIDYLEEQGLASPEMIAKMRKLNLSTYESQGLMRKSIGRLFKASEMSYVDISEIPDFAYSEDFKKILEGDTAKVGRDRGRDLLIGGSKRHGAITISGSKAKDLTQEQIVKEIAKQEGIDQRFLHFLQTKDGESFKIKPITSRKDSKIIGHKVEYDYINIADPTTVRYKGQSEADIKITAGTIAIRQNIDGSAQRAKLITPHGRKGTFQQPDDEIMDLLFGPDVEVVVHGEALKKKDRAELLNSRVNLAINKVQSDTSLSPREKADKLRAIVEVVREAEDQPDSIHLEGTDIITDISSHKKAGTLPLGATIGRLEQIAGDLGGIEFTVDGKPRTISKGVEEYRLFRSWTDFKISGAIPYGEDVPLSERQGVFKIGAREIQALDAFVTEEGHTLKKTADFYRRYSRALSTYQHPYLGSDEAGGSVWYDTVKRKYLTKKPSSLYGYVKGRKEQTVFERPNQIAALTKVITGSEGPTITLDGMATDLHDLDLSEISPQDVVLDRAFFRDTMKTKDARGPLTRDDFRGTIVDIDNYLRDLQHTVGDVTIDGITGEEAEALKQRAATTSSNILAIRKAINEQGGFNLGLATEVETPTGVHDKIWVPLEDLVYLGLGDDEEGVVTTGELYKHVVAIDALNRDIKNLEQTDYTYDDMKQLQARLTQEVMAYQEKAALKLSGSKGIVMDAMSAKVGSSSQFLVQIASPSAIGTSMDDAQIFVSESDVAKMIEGMPEEDIDFIMEQAQSGDIYGLVGRYPTTYSRSLNVAKVGVLGDDMLESGHAVLTPGMLVAMLGDADGDFISMTLAHYNSDIYNKVLDGQLARDEILGEMAQTHRSVGKEYTQIGANLYKDMQKFYSTFGIHVDDMTFTERELSSIVNIMAGNLGEEGQHADVFFEVLEEALGKGALELDLTDEQRDFLGAILTGQTDSAEMVSSFVQELQSGIVGKALNTDVQDMEAFAARFSRMNIGHFSNISTKMRQLGQIAHDASDTYFTASDLNILETTMQTLEQSGISSKHIELALGDVSSLSEAQAIVDERMRSAIELKDALLRGDKDAFREANKQLGDLFKEVVDLEEDPDIVQRGSIDEIFGVIRKMQNIFTESGSGDLNIVLYSPEMNFGKSQGVKSPKDIALINESLPKFVTPELATYYQRVGKEELVEQANKRLQKKVELLESTQHDAFSGYDVKYSSESIAKELIKDVVDEPTSKGLSKPAIFGLAAGGVWALSAALRESPYSRVEKDRQVPQEFPVADQAPGVDGWYTPTPQIPGPTARIIPADHGYEQLSVNITASNISEMTNDEIIALISRELQDQTPVDMNINARSTDNRQQVNKQWVDEVVARATRYGMGFY